MEVTLSPSNDILDEIETWLISEYDNSNSGFYCNWKVIQARFNKGDSAAILLNGIPVGFATWDRLFDATAQILIVEMKPRYRKSGYGRLLMERVFCHLKAQGVLVVDLECEPIESEYFWRKLGFNDIPSSIHLLSEFATCLFKPLVPTQPLAESVSKSEYIELWDDEPYITQNKPSKWRWEVETEVGSNDLIRPIIHPCRKDWRIRMVRNGRTIVDNKVKRFGGLEIHFAPFLVIRSLPSGL